MWEAAAAAADVVLPEDAINEILARVPDLVSLFRCSAVCKRWRSLIADPAFLHRRRLEPSGASAQEPSLLGFFVQRHRISTSSRRKLTTHFPTRAPALVPATGSPLGPERRFLTSFVRDDGGILDDAKPLAARGGLLLRVSPHPGDKNGVLRLCVCDLLTGMRDLLAPLDATAFFDVEGVRGYALLTAADHGAATAGRHAPADGYSTFFQVLLLGMARWERQLHLLRFSSSTAIAATSPIWSAHDCGDHHLWGPYGCCIAAVARGTAHWFFCDNDDREQPSLYTLDVSASTGCISATMLPFDVLPDIPLADVANSYAWLSTSIEERLSLLYIKYNRLAIWKQQDGDQAHGTLVWHLIGVVQVGVEVGLPGTNESLSFVCAGEKSGTMLALYHSDSECAYMLDLQSGSATKVEGWTRWFNYMTAVPFEINWQMFFTTRLGVQL
ncbi:unnamed protein product [Urochloa humidicola]